MRLEITPTTVDVHLTPLQKLGAVRRDISVPRSRITAATIDPEPLKSIQGMLRVGIRIPGVLFICSTGWGRHFWAIRRHTRAVHITLADGPGRLRELTVSHRDPDSVVAELERDTARRFRATRRTS